MINNLLSGFIGAVIGAVISSFLNYKIIKRQIRIESNRKFIETLIDVLQKIYLSNISRLEIPSELLNSIITFQAVNFKEFNSLNDNLNNLKNEIIRHQGRHGIFLQSTTTSIEENEIRNNITEFIKSLIKDIYKIT